MTWLVVAVCFARADLYSVPVVLVFSLLVVGGSGGLSYVALGTTHHVNCIRHLELESLSLKSCYPMVLAGLDNTFL